MPQNQKHLISDPPAPPILSFPNPPRSPPSPTTFLSRSINLTQQLRLQDIFPLFVLLARLIRLIVFPPHRLLALPTRDIPHHVPPRRHIAFDGLGLRDVDDGVEEVGFAVLAAEILGGG